MRRARYQDEGRIRIARADLPVRREEAGFDGGENEIFGFEWSRPVRKLGQGFTPGPLNATTQTVEQTACEVRGRFNNCDVYIKAPFSWIDPTTIAATDAVLTLNLYALLQGTEYPIHSQTSVLPGTLPDLIVVRGTGGEGDTWRALALQARGRPCDGFRATVSVTQTTTTDVSFLQGQISMYAWGEETASLAGGSVGPIGPITVTGTVTATPSAAPAEIGLTSAPHGGAATQLAARALTQGIVISNDDASSGNLFVSRSATAIAGAGLKLVPGASATLLVSNQNLLWVNSDAAGVNYRVFALS